MLILIKDIIDTIFPLFVATTVVIFIAVVLCVIDARFSWWTEQKATSPKLTFERFQSLYAIAPGNWKYELDTKSDNIPLFYLERFDNGRLKKEIRVQFSSYSEYRKFVEFAYDEQNKQDVLKKLRLEGDLANNLQKDIDEYRKKTNAELKAMKEKLEAEQERVSKKIQEQSQQHDTRIPPPLQTAG